jgi:hypothetical protein
MIRSGEEVFEENNVCWSWISSSCSSIITLGVNAIFVVEIEFGFEINDEDDGVVCKIRLNLIKFVDELIDLL